MKALMEQIMIDFVPQLDDADMSFCMKGDKELHVEMDVALMVRLFENVISNSIMYGKDGKEIVIQISKRDMNVEIEIKILGNVFRMRTCLMFLRSFIVVKNHVALIQVEKEWDLQLRKV